MNRRTLLAAALAAPSFVFDSAEAFEHEEGLPREEDLPVETVDVLVVGGGAGGLSAAVSAARAGAGSVLLIEKAAKIGGDTLISGGFFNAVLPERQRPFGIEDGVDLFVSQVLVAGEEENDPAVVRVLAEASGPALLWLESLGMRFLPEPVEIFGSRFRRSFKPIMSRGLGYIRALSAAAYSAGVAVRTRRAALRFAGDGRGGVVGVVVDSPEGKRLVRARRGVVLASGGFGANRGMISRYAPRVASFPIDSRPGSTGEMIVAAAEAGALLVNMTSVECVPGSREGIPYPIRLDYIPSRMIMVDAAGRLRTPRPLRPSTRFRRRTSTVGSMREKPSARPPRKRLPAGSVLTGKPSPERSPRIRPEAGSRRHPSGPRACTFASTQPWGACASTTRPTSSVRTAKCSSVSGPAALAREAFTGAAASAETASIRRSFSGGLRAKPRRAPSGVSSERTGACKNTVHVFSCLSMAVRPMSVAGRLPKLLR